MPEENLIHIQINLPGHADHDAAIVKFLTSPGNLGVPPRVYQVGINEDDKPSLTLIVEKGDAQKIQKAILDFLNKGKTR